MSEPIRKLRIITNGTTMEGAIMGMTKGNITFNNIVYPFDNKPKWPTPIVRLVLSNISTRKVTGVTKYKIYINDESYGYLDPNSQYHSNSVTLLDSDGNTLVDSEGNTLEAL